MHGVMIIQSLIGFEILVFFWVLIPVLMKVGVEPTFKLTTEVINFLFINVAFSATFLVLVSVAIHATTPLHISISSVIGVPLTYVVDWALHDYHFSRITIVGMVSVCVAVALVNISVSTLIKMDLYSIGTEERAKTRRRRDFISTVNAKISAGNSNR
jgi:hypothetical protein